jgi:hypothetical protein
VSGGKSSQTRFIASEMIRGPRLLHTLSQKSGQNPPEKSPHFWGVMGIVLHQLALTGCLTEFHVLIG